MSDGMAAFFEGAYFWKMPPQAVVNVGPTIINPLPKNYIDATAKYADQVRLTESPGGALNVENYHGGVPFPNPQEPHRAWKVLANVWYRYTPNISVANRSAGCTLDREGNARCTIGTVVYRQLSYNTDPGVPPTVPGAEGKYSSLWFMIDEPEEQRYTAALTIAYADPARSEDLYAFIPSLRRYQPVSTAARCSTTDGVDITQEDYRGGFDSNITQFKADFIGEKKILALIIPGTMPPGRFPNDYEMPIGWPAASWGKWQMRDVYVISISKLPKYASGYCYGKRVMYVDKTTYLPLWEELYDSDMKLWKIVGLFNQTLDVPGVGPVDSSNSLIYSFWDIQNDHASFVADPTDNPGPFYVNGQVPKEYLDVARYTTPGGLNMIMR